VVWTFVQFLKSPTINNIYFKGEFKWIIQK